MLSYNVAGLLRSAPGTSRTYPVAVEAMPIAEDLELSAPIRGEVRLSRIGDSILAEAHLDTAVAETCSRCLIPISAPIRVDLREEALPSVDIDSGLPVDERAGDEALRLDEHHELHLGPAVRDAISLAEPIAPLCRPDCLGLCTVCGIELNLDPTHAHPDGEIDPRLASLVEIRDRLES
jgi:uncharacterized protein